MDNQSEIILYQTESGQTKLEVRLENETVWLSQKQMTELFQRERSVITKHINNVFKENELQEDLRYIKKFSNIIKQDSIIEYIDENVQKAIQVYRAFVIHSLKDSSLTRSQKIDSLLQCRSCKLKLDIKKIGFYDKKARVFLYSVYKEKDIYYNNKTEKKSDFFKDKLEYDNYFLVALDSLTNEIRYLSGNFILSEVYNYEEMLLNTLFTLGYDRIVDARLFQFQVNYSYLYRRYSNNDYLCYRSYSKVLDCETLTYIGIKDPNDITMKYWKCNEGKCNEYTKKFVNVPKDPKERNITVKPIEFKDISRVIRVYIPIEDLILPDDPEDEEE